MRFYFLGTSSGMPTTYRNTSAMIFSFNHNAELYLFDCGEGTQHRLFRSPYSIAKISNIFITHLHGDHFYGLLGLLSTRMLLGINTPLYLYAPKGIKKFINKSFKLSRCELNYPLEIIEFEAGETLKDTEDFSLKVLSVEHNIETYAFLLEEKQDHFRFNVEKAKQDKIPEGPIYGELSKGKDIPLEGRALKAQDYRTFYASRRRIVFCSDNNNPSILGEYAQELSLLIHEATHTEEVKKGLSFKSYHTTAKEVALFAEKFCIKNLLLHHFSPRFSLIAGNSPSISELEEEAKGNYSGRVFLARDFLEYSLSKSSVLSLRKSFG